MGERPRGSTCAPERGVGVRSESCAAGHAVLSSPPRGGGWHSHLPCLGPVRGALVCFALVGQSCLWPDPCLAAWLAKPSGLARCWGAFALAAEPWCGEQLTLVCPNPSTARKVPGSCTHRGSHRGHPATLGPPPHDPWCPRRPGLQGLLAGESSSTGLSRGTVCLARLGRAGSSTHRTMCRARPCLLLQDSASPAQRFPHVPWCPGEPCSAPLEKTICPWPQGYGREPGTAEPKPSDANASCT